jgi:hypothetical protein
MPAASATTLTARGWPSARSSTLRNSAFGDVANSDVVIWDLHESDARDRGAIFAALKAHLVAYLLERPGRAAFIVDEAVTVTEDDLGARTLGDLVRRGRHFGLEVYVLTQRVTDWFDSRIGREYRCRYRY